MEEVFDITDTAVLVLDELVMWFALVGHIVPPKCDPDPPSWQLQGFQGLSALGGTECRFSP